CSPRIGVVIAADRTDRSDRLQLLQQAAPADVSRMHNEVRIEEKRARLRTQQAVCIGDQAHTDISHGSPIAAALPIPRPRQPAKKSESPWRGNVKSLKR